MQLRKFHQFPNDVIIVDGMWGVGKSAITPIIATLKGIEKKRIDPIFEYVTTLNWLGLLDDSGAKALIATYSDYFTYHNRIGREVNLRLRDDSGLGNSPGKLRYVRRLFSNDGDVAQLKIYKENPGTLIVSDFAIFGFNLLAESLDSRLRFIEIVRHPLYLINYVQNYLREFDRPREFTLAFDLHGQKVPWMAQSWASEYLSLTLLEKSMLMIARAQSKVIDYSESPNILTVSFEQFVTETSHHVELISDFLGRPVHYSPNRLMKRHKLPRDTVSAGRKSNSRSWVTDDDDSEEEIYLKLVRDSRSNVKSSVWSEFITAIGQYETIYPSSLSQIGRKIRMTPS